MARRNVLCNQSMVRWMLLGLALAFSALGVEGQIPPIPLPVPSAPVFSSPQDVSNGGVSTYQMAVDSAGNVNLAWQNNSPGDVFFSRSSDGGRTFSAPTDLSNAPTNFGSFQIALDSSGNIYLVWFNVNANVISSIRSTDGGASFSVPVAISINPGPPSLTIGPSGKVFLCWTTAAVPRSIFCSDSADGGATYSSPVKVADLNRGFLPPLIAVDGAGNINLAWIDDFLIPNSDFSFYHDVFFSSSRDGGATFSASQDLSGHLNFPPSLSMALDPSGNINILWESIPHGNVFLNRSNDGGATFFRTQVTPYLSTGLSPTPEAPSMALDSCGNINVVWFDDSLGNLAVFFSRSIDGGGSFSVPRNLSGTTTDSRAPQIAADSGGNINVVWEEKTPGSPSNNFISDIFFTRSGDGGGSFSTPQNISNDAGRSTASAIALDSGGNINVAWMDDTPGTLDVFFSRGAIAVGPLLNVCVPVALPGVGTPLAVGGWRTPGSDAHAAVLAH
jgi:hypothetical protein